MTLQPGLAKGLSEKWNALGDVSDVTAFGARSIETNNCRTLPVRLQPDGDGLREYWTTWAQTANFTKILVPLMGTVYTTRTISEVRAVIDMAGCSFEYKNARTALPLP